MKNISNFNSEWLYVVSLQQYFIHDEVNHLYSVFNVMMMHKRWFSFFFFFSFYIYNMLNHLDVFGRKCIIAKSKVKSTNLLTTYWN